MQTSTSVHSYISDYLTVKVYHLAYAKAIFPVSNNDKSTDNAVNVTYSSKQSFYGEKYKPA